MSEAPVQLIIAAFDVGAAVKEHMDQLPVTAFALAALITS